MTRTFLSPMQARCAYLPLPHAGSLCIPSSVPCRLAVHTFLCPMQARCAYLPLRHARPLCIPSSSPCTPAVHTFLCPMHARCAYLPLSHAGSLCILRHLFRVLSLPCNLVFHPNVASAFYSYLQLRSHCVQVGPCVAF